MTEPELPLALTQEEKRSQIFLKLMDHWNKRLKTYRLQNDGDKDDKSTANLRGRIAELKAMIALADDPRKID